MASLVAVPLKFVNTGALRGGRGRGGPDLYTHIFGVRRAWKMISRISGSPDFNFYKPWASGHVAAGAFFFSEKWPPYFWNMSPRKIDNILKISGIWSKISWFLENKKDAHRPYDQFGGSIAPRSPLCVRKRKFLFWVKIGNRSQTSCVNEKGGRGGRGVLDLYTDALSTCLKGQLPSC